MHTMALSIKEFIPLLDWITDECLGFRTIREAITNITSSSYVGAMVHNSICWGDGHVFNQWKWGTSS